MSFLEPPTEPEIPDENTRSHGKKKMARESFFSGILEWLGTLITEQARADGLSKNVHQISVHTDRLDKIGESAAHIAADLTELKKRLVDEFGQQSQGFVSKCVDPMIDQVSGLAEKLRQNSHPKADNDFLNYAVECVRFYSSLDEGRLRQKIVRDAHKLIQHAIEKDMEVLAKYKKELQTNTENEPDIDRVLLPIFGELKNMAHFRIETGDLAEFFLWKNQIDEKRNALVEMGLFLIDSFVGKADSERAFTDQDLTGTRHMDEHSDDWAVTSSALSVLEGRLSELLDLLENCTHLNVEALSVLEQLLEGLDAQAEQFFALHSKSRKVRKRFSRIREGISRAQKMIKSKSS